MRRRQDVRIVAGFIGFVTFYGLRHPRLVAAATASISHLPASSVKTRDLCGI
ncbi:hypothetical protein [Paenibacillus ginsengarvi]|uniref:hypothetical protein n=1 Tax=Paenibacillus ginsengarvi TaxID=400777 RepID=UPI001876F5CB|nr:hypothetical protein [Paenibacillus ginsengarvi]